MVRRDLGDGVLEELWFGDDDPHRSLAEALQSFAAQIAKIKGLKPFPAVAQRLLQLMQDPEARIEQVTSAVESDPAIAARTMRLANSALFRVGHPVDTLDQALIRVGMHATYQMVVAFAVLGSFTDTGMAGQRVRDHCVGVAAISRAIAKRRSWPGYSQVFLCGLLHDFGKLLLIECEEFSYTDLPVAYADQGLVHLYERERLGYDHAVLAGHVLSMWELPELLAKAVAWHHQPVRAYAAGGDEAFLVAYLRLADRIEHDLRSGIEATPHYFAELASDPAAAYVDVSAMDLKQFWESIVESRREALIAFA